MKLSITINVSHGTVLFEFVCCGLQSVVSSQSRLVCPDMSIVGVFSVLWIVCRLFCVVCRRSCVVCRVLCVVCRVCRVVYCVLRVRCSVLLFVCLFALWFACLLVALFFKRLCSTSPPSGNQVDGLPLVLHNTRAVVVGVLLGPALFNDN